MRNRWWAAPILAGAAVVLAACGSSASPSSGAASANSPAASSGSSTTTISGSTPGAISTRKTSIGTVLTNAKGQTLYWFAIDTSTKSNCTGSCATYWPPVLGAAHAAAGAGAKLTMGFGTIMRSGGQLQATYDGHPLYTYAADSGPGQATGNDKNLSGGLWWAMTPSGLKLTAAHASGSSSSSSSGGGYGY